MVDKVVFLDIDGVLNSVKYDRERTAKDGNIDISRLPLLKRIIEATGAEIVLVSSWRKHWEREEEMCDGIGREINKTFRSAGLRIYDKTPALGERAEEITHWLGEHTGVAKYVIIDDSFGGWGAHEPFLVKTNCRIGRGLEEVHVAKAIEILNGA